MGCIRAGIAGDFRCPGTGERQKPVSAYRMEMGLQVFAVREWLVGYGEMLFIIFSDRDSLADGFGSIEAESFSMVGITASVDRDRDSCGGPGMDLFRGCGREQRFSFWRDHAKSGKICVVDAHCTGMGNHRDFETRTG